MAKGKSKGKGKAKPVESKVAHLGRKISKKAFEEELAKLQTELVLLQEWVKAEGLRVVVVFEGRDKPGGYLRHAIPSYRLPHEVVDADIASLTADGKPPVIYAASAVARVEPAMKAYVDEGLKPMLAAIRSGKLEEARQLYGSRVSALSKPMMASTDELITLQVDVAKSEYDAAAKLADRTEAGLVFLTLASMLLGILLA